ncbi:putative methyltransferase-domain-containing protein [Piptocephalis cylindrospora]|uniref:Putative methyltransferase-domain-containing protein n=1 Tax=Piptocephalis cylindrospora TaxID=1907219 RepID=A0A4P9Y0C0_9FUNG|nr:putative methyltransferase-domain-containing protein [Piptocephalis cylindrospora]|eukprot:RKP12203.1 putative methyltransferase-domain-containing protein [Piptocephalis cylindrospora]
MSLLRLVFLKPPLSQYVPGGTMAFTVALSNDLGDNEALEKGEVPGLRIEVSLRRVGTVDWVAVGQVPLDAHVPVYSGQTVQVSVPRRLPQGLYQVRLAHHSLSQVGPSPILGAGASILRDAPPLLLLPIVSEVFTLGHGASKVQGIPTTHCYRELPWTMKGSTDPLILQESCSDRTLGGRVWDASLVTLSFLRALFSEGRVISTAPPVPSGWAIDQLTDPGLWQRLYSVKAQTNHALMERVRIDLGIQSSPLKEPGSKECGEQSRVIELGSGCGVVGLALARRLGPKGQVILTDLDEVLEETTRSNLSLQAVPPLPEIATLAWGDIQAAERIQASLKGPVDLIIGSDIIYNAAYHHDLLHSLRALLPPGAWFLLGYKPRLPQEEGEFFRLIHAAGFRGSIIWSEGGLYTWAWKAPDPHGRSLTLPNGYLAS